MLPRYRRSGTGSGKILWARSVRWFNEGQGLLCFPLLNEMQQIKCNFSGVGGHVMRWVMRVTKYESRALKTSLGWTSCWSLYVIYMRCLFIANSVEPHESGHVQGRTGWWRAVWFCSQCWFSDAARVSSLGSIIFRFTRNSKVSVMAFCGFLFTDYAYWSFPESSAVGSNVVDNGMRVCSWAIWDPDEMKKSHRSWLRRALCRPVKFFDLWQMFTSWVLTARAWDLGRT